MKVTITKEYLQKHPNEIFVFGDNIIRKGYNGAAKLRDEKNAYGFITKKYPDNNDISFYTPDEYKDVYFDEIKKLKSVIELHQDKLFLISKLGSGLANRYRIFESVIEPNIMRDLSKFDNVEFLW
jgi:hypothetical protein